MGSFIGGADKAIAIYTRLKILYKYMVDLVNDGGGKGGGGGGGSLDGGDDGFVGIHLLPNLERKNVTANAT